MSDVSRPLKPSMPEYVRTEERLLDLIYEKFLGSPLNEEEKKLFLSVTISDSVQETTEDFEPDITQMSFWIRQP